MYDPTLSVPALIHEERQIRTKQPSAEVSPDDCCLFHSEPKLRTHSLPPANVLWAPVCVQRTAAVLALQQRNLFPVLSPRRVPRGTSVCWNTRPAACSPALPNPHPVASSAQMLWANAEGMEDRRALCGAVIAKNHNRFKCQEQQTNRRMFCCHWCRDGSTRGCKNTGRDDDTCVQIISSWLNYVNACKCVNLSICSSPNMLYNKSKSQIGKTLWGQDVFGLSPVDVQSGSTILNFFGLCNNKHLISAETYNMIIWL